MISIQQNQNFIFGWKCYRDGSWGRL